MTGGEADFGRCARLCRWVLDRLLEQGLHRGDLLNVNVPCLGEGRPVGVRVVPQSTAELEDRYHRHVDESGRESFSLADEYAFAPGQDNADVPSVAEGFITITPLHVDMTDHARLDELVGRDWPKPPMG
jgi:5'-nucleotidase